MQTSLLALHGTSVTGEQAGLLEGRAVSRVVDVQCAGDSQTQSAGLAGRATTVDGDLNVELAIALKDGQRLQDVLLVQLVPETSPSTAVPLTSTSRTSCTSRTSSPR